MRRRVGDMVRARDWEESVRFRVMDRVRVKFRVRVRGRAWFRIRVRQSHGLLHCKVMSWGTVTLTLTLILIINIAPTHH